jgi:hypothetical protein
LFERGYTIENNTFEFVVVPITYFNINPEDPLAARKEKMMNDLIKDKR